MGSGPLLRASSLSNESVWKCLHDQQQQTVMSDKDNSVQTVQKTSCSFIFQIRKMRIRLNSNVYTSVLTWQLVPKSCCSDHPVLKPGPLFTTSSFNVLIILLTDINNRHHDGFHFRSASWLIWVRGIFLFHHHLWLYSLGTWNCWQQ